MAANNGPLDAAAGSRRNSTRSSPSPLAMTSSSSSTRASPAATKITAATTTTTRPAAPTSTTSSPSVSPKNTRRFAPVLARWQFENQNQGTSIHDYQSPAPTPERKASIPISSPPAMAATATAPATALASLGTETSDLAEQIQNLSLSDDQKKDAARQRTPPPSMMDTDVAAQVAHIADAIANVRSTVFQLEEQRHSGGAITDLEMTMIQMDDRLESISRDLQRVEAAVQSADKTTPTTGASEDSDDDDDDFAIPGVETSPLPPAARLDELNRDWADLQHETDTLKRELADDKYIAHFNTGSKQAESLMDSLERALAICSKFVNDFHSGVTDQSDDEDADGQDPTTRRLQRLHSVMKGFHTKRSYYTPACEQTFAAFDRSLKERSTSHGALIRKFTDLKNRWREMKERSARMDRELRKIEVALTAAQNGEDAAQAARPPPSASPPLPLKSSRRGVSGQRNPASAMSSSPSTGSILPPPRSTAAAAASSSRHHRSISITPAASEAGPGPRSASRSRPLSVVGPSGVHSNSNGHASALSRSVGPGVSDASPLSSSASKRNSAYLSPSKPPSSYRYRFHSGNLGSPSDRDAAVQARSKTPQPAGSSPSAGHLPRNVRAGSEPPAVPRIPSAYRQQSSQRDGNGNDAAAAEESIEYMDPAADLSLESREPEGTADSSFTSHSRPGSALGGNNNYPLHYRPPSVAGSHYDAPDAAPTTKAARRQSRIPTYTFPTSSSGTDGRPSSSLSQSSNARFAIHNRGASRSTMQTPEPQIAARVQGLRMFSKPSTGGQMASTSSNSKRMSGVYPSSTTSRPPPTRLNNAGGAGPSRLGATGRTTPLSASALAKVPHAGPVSFPGGNSSSTSFYAHSNASGSVANYRASKQAALRTQNSATPTYYSSSIRDGAVTPTFSEGGASNFSAAAGGGGLSRLYRANPNDALDVAVSTITNALGIPLTRIDEPLPRGMKTETGPGKEVRGRYSFGSMGTAMMCKLLELHRPAAMSHAGIGGGGKQRKVLVKVSGKGFLDLELWLLSAFE